MTFDVERDTIGLSDKRVALSSAALFLCLCIRLLLLCRCCGLLLVQLLEQLGDGLACLLAAAGRAHTDATGSRAAQLARASAAEAEKVLFSHVVHLLSVVLEHSEKCVVDDVERKQRDAKHDKPLATKGEVAARCVAGRNECQRGDESADTGREDLCNPDGRNENRSVNLPVHLVLLSLEGLRRLNDCAAVFAAVLALAPR